MGGLGNQLFQLAFAVAVKNHLSYEVAVDPGRLKSRRGIKGRHLAIDPSAFGLRESRSSSWIWRLPACLRSNLAIEYVEPNNWSLDILSESTRATRGYFQNSELVDSVAGVFLPDLEELLPTSDTASPYVAVHIRIGDYAKPLVASVHGLTDPNWSLEQCRALSEMVGIDRKVIFTDSPEVLRSMIGNSDLRDFEFDDSREPAQVLGHLAGSSALVMSNSTLSWWAARLMSQRTGFATPVIFPSPWMARPSQFDKSLEVRGWVCAQRLILTSGDWRPG
jgi:hypothetical protein